MCVFKNWFIWMLKIKTDLKSLCLAGGFAFVYEAQDLGSGKEYALKVKWIYLTPGLQRPSFPNTLGW